MTEEGTTCPNTAGHRWVLCQCYSCEEFGDEVYVCSQKDCVVNLGLNKEEYRTDGRR